MSESLEIIGHISQIRPSDVLFEFRKDNSVAVGSIKIEDIKCYDRKGELVYKNFRVGDKLRCSVTKVEGENDDDEDTKYEWVATSAELIESGSDSADNEDVLVLEDHLDNMFNYEVDQEDEDEEAGVKDEKPDVKKDVKGASSASKPTGKSEGTSSKKPVDSKKIVKVDCLRSEKAVLIQFIKPKREGAKTINAIFALLTGPLKGQTLAASTYRMSIWGYKMDLANLVYFLRYGEECTFQYRPSNKPEDPIDRFVWFGTPNLEVPSKPETCPGFAAWLKSHKVTEADFMSWINNRLPKKPYHPLISFIYSARVKAIAWNNANVGVGAFIQIKGMFRAPSPMIVRDPLVPREAYAFLRREDFYMCGVSVDQANLCHLLWPDDAILVQLRPISRAERVSLQGFLSQRPDLNVGFTAYYGNIGPTRPTDLVLDPAKAPDLTKYLRRKRLTLAQFEAVRAGTYQPAVDPQQPNMPPSLMEIQMANSFVPFGEPTGKISKIQTNRGLVLSTRKSTERTVADRLGPLDHNHKPSRKVEADFVKTKRLQDFRSEEEQQSAMSRRVINEDSSWTREREPEVQPEQGQSEEFKVVSKIINRFLDLKSQDDPRIEILLQNPAEVKMAMNMTAILTKALSFSIGNDTPKMASKPVSVSTASTVRRDEKRPARLEAEKPDGFRQGKRGRDIDNQPRRDEVNPRTRGHTSEGFDQSLSKYPRRELSPERGRGQSASKFEDPRDFPVSDRSMQVRSRTPPGARYEDLPRERGRYEEHRHQKERAPEGYVESQAPYDRNYREEPSQYKPASNRIDVNPMLKVDPQSFNRYREEQDNRQINPFVQSRHSDEIVNPMIRHDEGVYETFGVRTQLRPTDSSERSSFPRERIHDDDYRNPVGYRREEQLQFDERRNNANARPNVPAGRETGQRYVGNYEGDNISTRNAERYRGEPSQVRSVSAEYPILEEEKRHPSGPRRQEQQQPQMPVRGSERYNEHNQDIPQRSGVGNDRFVNQFQSRSNQYPPESNTRSSERFPDPMTNSQINQAASSARAKDGRGAVSNPYQSQVEQQGSGYGSFPLRQQPQHFQSAAPQGGSSVRLPAFPKPAGSCMTKESWEEQY